MEAEFEDIRTASGVRRKGAILKKTEVEEQVQQFNKTVILLAQYACPSSMDTSLKCHDLNIQDILDFHI